MRFDTIPKMISLQFIERVRIIWREKFFLPSIEPYTNISPCINIQNSVFIKKRFNKYYTFYNAKRIDSYIMR